MKAGMNKVPASSTRSWRRALLLSAVTFMTISYHPQAGGKNENPGVIPPQASYRGLSYGEWGAEFWRYLMDIPVVDGDHPYFTGDPFSGPDGMVFLIFPWTDSLDITIPAGTPLFCAVVGTESSTIEAPPYYGANESDLRASAIANLNATSSLFAEIDGVAVKNLWGYRAQSPLYEFGPLPADNLFDSLYPADLYPELQPFDGATALSVAAGVYLLLPPLSVGTHTIRASATYADLGHFDGIYNITVVPHK